MVSDSTLNQGVLTPEQMIANAREAAEAARQNRLRPGASEVERLLAERDTPLDTVQLSPVERILQAREQEAQRAIDNNYFESDEYIQLKVNQLRSQLSIYSNLPGLDPTGGILDSIEAEIREILEKQAADLAESEAAAAEAEARIAEQERERANAALSPEEMLQRAADSVNGVTRPTEVTDAAQRLLDSLRVDTTA